MRLQDIDVTGFETLLLDRDGVVNRLRPDDYVKQNGKSLNFFLEYLKF